MPITYPRPCPKCGTKIKNRGNFSRHKKRCGTSEHRVQRLHCPKTYSRKDDMLKHVRKSHSEGAKRIAVDTAELIRLELLHSGKVPRSTVDSQIGGAVSTRGLRKVIESPKIDPKPVKDEPRAVKRKLEDDVDMSHLLDDGLDNVLVERANRLEFSENPLFKANLTFLPNKRQGLKGAVKKEQLNNFLFEAVRDTILKENLRDSTKVHLTLTSKEHSIGTANSGYLSHLKYGIPVKQVVKRGDYVHAMFESLARKMNSAQNMNPAIGFSATLTFITYHQKGGKGPAPKNPNRFPFHLMHKKKDCMIKITNSDDLCCARTIVTMKAYVDGTYKQYDNLRRGRNIQERLAKQLRREANVPEGACGFEKLKNFQEYLGPNGYKIIVINYVSCAFISQGNVDGYV